MSGLLARYARRLPTIGFGGGAPLSLGEGDTPLVPLRRLPAHLGLPDGVSLSVKVEGSNPTGSFKDRGMVVAVAKAKAAGARCVICASTGNTSAAAAAYAGRAGLPCVVLIPSGKVAAGKLAQAVAFGAIIVQVEGNFDDAMRVVRKFADDGTVAVVNSINPMRLQGQKTAAFEVVEALGEAPDYHALPVGNAGNITAYWIGYSEAAGCGTMACTYCDGYCRYPGPEPRTARRPRMLGYQAAGAAPFVRGRPVDSPETVATAIRIGRPQSFEAARTAVEESEGWIRAVSDEDILHAQRLLASMEGVFCEPASAASVAGVVNDLREGRLPADAQVVCTLTGHGLKDPDVFQAPATQVVPKAELAAWIRRVVETVSNG